MIKKKVFIIIVAALSAVVVIQSLIIFRPFGKQHEVTDPENAILIAKAELIRRYGEAEIRGKEFIVFVDQDHPNQLYVTENIAIFDYSEHVYVRRSDGRAVVIWRDNVILRWLDDLIGQWLFR